MNRPARLLSVLFLSSIISMLVLSWGASATVTEEYGLGVNKIYEQVGFSPDGAWGVFCYLDTTTGGRVIQKYVPSTGAVITVDEVRLLDEPRDIEWIDNNTAVISQRTEYNVIVHLSSGTTEYMDYAVSQTHLAMDHANNYLWYTKNDFTQEMGYYDLSDESRHVEISGGYLYSINDIEVLPNGETIVTSGETIWQGSGGSYTQYDFGSYFTSPIKDVELDSLDSNYVYVGGGSNILFYMNITTHSFTDFIQVDSSLAYSIWDIDVNRNGDIIVAGNYKVHYVHHNLLSSTLLHEYNDYQMRLNQMDHLNTMHPIVDEYCFILNRSTLTRYDYDLPLVNITTPDDKIFVPPGPVVINGTSSYKLHPLYKIDVWVDDTDLYVLTSDLDVWSVEVSIGDEGLHWVNATGYDNVRDIPSFETGIRFTYNIPPTVNITYPNETEIDEGATIRGNCSADSTSVQVKIDSGLWVAADLTGTSWSYTLAKGVTGTIDVYVRSYDGTNYSEEAHKRYHVGEDPTSVQYVTQIEKEEWEDFVVNHYEIIVAAAAILSVSLTTFAFVLRLMDRKQNKGLYG